MTRHYSLSIFLLSFLSLLYILNSVKTLSAEETTLSTLQQIASYARSHNLEYKQAVWEAEKIRNKTEDIFQLEKSTISVSANQARTSEFTPDISTQATIPIINQLSLTATVNQDLVGSFGVTISPLVHTNTRESQQLNTRQANLEAETTGKNAETGSIRAALTWMNLQKQLTVQKQKTGLSQTAYEEEKIRYEADESSLEEVKNKLIEWSNNQNTFTKLQKDTLEAESSLYNNLNATRQEVKIKLFEIETLIQAIDNMEKKSILEQKTHTDTFRIQLSQIKTEFIRSDLNNTWLFEPDMKVSVQTTLPSFPGTEQAILSGNISLNFTPENWNAQERKELKRDLALSQEELVQKQLESTQNYEKLVLALENAQQTSNMQKLKMEQMALVLKESKLLHNQGDLSELELQDAGLSYKKEENAYFQTLADEYLAWLDIINF